MRSYPEEKLARCLPYISRMVEPLVWQKVNSRFRLVGKKIRDNIAEPISVPMPLQLRKDICHQF